MKTFHKKDNPDGWPFADGEYVEVHVHSGSIIAVIDGAA